jgi:hypothetical protein
MIAVWIWAKSFLRATSLALHWAASFELEELRLAILEVLEVLLSFFKDADPQLRI